MPNLFSGINLALRAMLSHQQAIEVIEHNVANANTPGYHRQEAVLAAGLPYPAPSLWGAVHPGQMGTGVQVDEIRRFNLDFFDDRYQRESADKSRWDMQSEVLQQVESTMAETTEDGLIPKLDAFWSGWQALNSDPSNMALRSDLRERAIALTGALNGRAKSLMALREDQDLAIRQRVDEINTTAAQVARLNGEIAAVKASGDSPNDLLDQRDQLLDRLAQVAGAVVKSQDNGEAMVSIGSHALVIGTNRFELAVSPDPANSNLAGITWAVDGRPFDPARGELTGLLDARDRAIPAQMSGLNDLASTLANRINTLHRAGFGLNNATNQDFFEPFTTTDYALEIHVSTNLDDLANIAAASVANAPGDGSNAAALENVRHEMLMSGGTATINGFYTGQIGELGVELKSAQNRAKDHGLVLSSLESMRESVSGVSLDEEAANLVKSQRAYQASARILTALDEMLDKVINGMGMVGR